MIQAPIAQAFARGLAHHRAGRLAEAESVYRRILEAAPGHPDALHLLGVIAHHAGRDDAALELVDGALQVNPAHPGYRQQRGRVLTALGRLDEAVASFRAALASSPDYVEAQAGLGNVLKLLGRPAESIECYRRALALRPDFAEAHANLGNALHVLGHANAALASYARALQWVDTPDIRSAFAQCLRGAIFDGAEASRANAPDIRILVLRALDEPWARPSDLAAACIRLIRCDPVIGECVARASRAWPERLLGAELFGSGGFAAVAGDALLRTLLESAQACDLAMERFLTMARHAMLDAAGAGGDAENEGGEQP
ncbi:MAG: tetratricopeptide repeat protein, partial [Betaproteobacteria bacterium]|nr:tetratricopeptide repeat protein [Betaproteobacteria bacterium]